MYTCLYKPDKIEDIYFLTESIGYPPLRRNLRAETPIFEYISIENKRHKFRRRAAHPSRVSRAGWILWSIGQLIWPLSTVISVHLICFCGPFLSKEPTYALRFHCFINFQVVECKGLMPIIYAWKKCALIVYCKRRGWPRILVVLYIWPRKGNPWERFEGYNLQTPIFCWS